MTRKQNYETAAVASSYLKFGPNAGRAERSSLHQIPSDDILQYIHEMCATLCYMSITHKFERLSGLLAAAAAEAEFSRPAEAHVDRSVGTVRTDGLGGKPHTRHSDTNTSQPNDSPRRLYPGDRDD